MKQYVNLIKNILANGENRPDRTGTGTRSIFGGDLSFDLRERFPLVTIKKTLYDSAFTEMLWFISGDTNIKFLTDRKIPIWNGWADENGNLGPVYGYQWRFWNGKIVKTFDSDHDYLDVGFDKDGNPLKQEKVDQLKNLINDLRSNPMGRRHIVTAWNPGFINEMGLPPCHYTFQCYVSTDKRFLDLRINIRSWDVGLGAPFNIAQYALLTHLIARASNLTARKFSISYGDAHLYNDHVDLIEERVNTVEPIDCPTRLIFKTGNIDIDGYKPEDFEITGYECHPFLKLKVSI
jgi:thymidylate synthase